MRHSVVDVSHTLALTHLDDANTGHTSGESGKERLGGTDVIRSGADDERSNGRSVDILCGVSEALTHE